MGISSHEIIGGNMQTFESWMRDQFEYDELKDMINHGVISGFHGLIYYSETTALYCKFKNEIWDILYEDAMDYGCTTLEFISKLNGNVNSSDTNTIQNNIVTNSANITASRDGIRIMSSDAISCNNNTVNGNTANDNQPIKTQAYGLNINSANCQSNIVVSNNIFTPNKTGTIKDLGTNTIYQ